jgi:hypothetical protein
MAGDTAADTARDATADEGVKTAIYAIAEKQPITRYARSAIGLPRRLMSASVYDAGEHRCEGLVKPQSCEELEHDSFWRSADR